MTIENHETIDRMNQAAVRSYLRDLRKGGHINFNGSDADAQLGQFINGQLAGFTTADLKAVAKARLFPLAGMTLPAVGGDADKADTKPAPAAPAAPAINPATASREDILRQLLDGVSRDEVVQLVNSAVEDRLPDSIPTKRIVVTPAKTVDIGAAHRHAAFDEIVTLIGLNLHTNARRFNVAIVGQAGSGKTDLAAQVAEALELPFYSTGKIEAEFQLVGFRDAHGNIHRTDFEKAFTEGGLFLFDEFDGSNPRAVTRFNAALSNGWCDFPDGKKKAHKNFRAIAASNTFWGGATREYVGRNQLDAATKDRFSFVEVNIDPKLETALAEAYEGGKAIAKRVQKVRKAVAKLKIRHVVSMRATLDVCAFVGANFTQARAERLALWKDLSDADVLKIENEIAK